MMLPDQRGARWAPRLVLVGLAVLATAPGCRYTGIPDWVHNIPTSADHLYATGMFHGSLDSADDRPNAIAEARRELARTVRTRITQLAESRQYGERRTHIERSLASSEVILEHSQEVASWIDHDGMAGPRRAYWVLMRLPKKVPDQ